MPSEAQARARAENKKKLGGGLFVGTPGDVHVHNSMTSLLGKIAEHLPLAPGEPVDVVGFRSERHARLLEPPDRGRGAAQPHHREHCQDCSGCAV